MILCIWYPAQRSWGDMLVFFSVFSSFVYMFPFSSFIHNELYDMSTSWPGQVQKLCINPNYVFNWTRTILYHARNMNQWSTTYFISGNFLIMEQIEIPSLAGLYQSPYDTKVIDINIQLYKKVIIMIMMMITITIRATITTITSNSVHNIENLQNPHPFVRGIHWWTVDSPHKCVACQDVIMSKPMPCINIKTVFPRMGISIHFHL